MRYSVYTDPTPNSFKVLIALEELAQQYTTHRVDFAAEEQKSAEFLELNPNGKVPVLIDHGSDDFKVIESGAILLYLAERHGGLLPEDPKDRSEAVQ